MKLQHGMNLQKLQALFMILLVLTLPLFSVGALATPELRDVQVSGRDLVQGYARSSPDQITVTVRAKDDDRAIKPEQVRSSYPDPDTPFTLCTADTNGYSKCMYTTAEAERAPNVYPFTINLLDTLGVPLADTASSFIVDGNPPTIDSFDVTPYQINTDLTLHYTTHDTACDTCPAGSCSGLADYDVVSNGEVVLTIDISLPTSNTPLCTKQGDKQTTAQDLNLNEGAQDLCIKVRDKFKQTATSCKRVIVDYSAPSFVQGSFKIVDSNGNEMHFSKSTELPAKVMINVTDISAFAIPTTVADFSKLNADRPEYAQLQVTSCDPGEGENVKVCIWDNLLIKNVGEAQLSIVAQDVVGNSREFRQTVNLPVDDTGPIVREIVTTNDRYLNAINNIILVHIDEAGSGMNLRQAFLDLREIGGADRVQAESCVQGAGWECRFQNIVATGIVGESSVVLINAVSDDLGNAYDAQASSTSASFIFDNELPRIINVSIRPKGSEAQVLTVGDIAEVVAYVQEQYSGISADRALLNLQGITATPIPADNCTPAQGSEQNQYICTWEYGGELSPGTVEANVIITDDAGYTVDSARQSPRQVGRIQVLDIKELRVVDFFEDEARVDRIPELNRHFLWQSVNTIQKVVINIVPKGTAHSTVQTFDVKQCVGKLDKDRAAVQQFGIRTQFYLDVEGGVRTQKLFLMEIPQQQKNVTLESTKVVAQCTGEIVQSVGSRTRGQVVSPNEQFNVSIVVPLRAARLQFLQPDLETINDIAHHKGAIDKLDTIINFLDFITSILNKICKPIAVVLQVINSTCLALSNLFLYFTPYRGVVEGCDAISETLNGLWSGTSGVFGKKPEMEYTSSATGRPYPTWGSSKDWASLGYACDLVLCQECTTTWNEFILDDARKSIGERWGRIYANAEKNAREERILTTQDKAIRELGGDYLPQFNVNPYNSLAVAVICSPPCLGGIQNKLSIYREILMAHNVCLNIAAVRGNAEHAECNKFKRTQLCKQIVGEFWFALWGVAKQFVVKLMQAAFEKYVLKVNACKPPAAQAFAAGPWKGGCWALRIYEGFIALQSVKDAVVAWQEFIDILPSSDEDSDERQEDIEGKAVGDLCTPGKGIEEGCV